MLEADRDERLALVFCARRIIDSRSRALMTRRYPRRGSGVIPARAVLRGCIRSGANLLGEPGGLLFRTALARRVGAFDANLRLVTDLDYWFRLLLHGDAYYLPDRLASFRVSQAAWSVAIGTAQAAEFLAFIAKAGANPAFGLSALDMACGRLLARVNTLAKLFFYRLVLRYTATLRSRKTANCRSGSQAGPRPSATTYQRIPSLRSRASAAGARVSRATATSAL